MANHDPCRARAIVALLAGLFCACGGAGGGATSDVGVGSTSSAWGALYWVNSNSGPTFAWSLDGLSAAQYVAVALAGEPAGGSACAPFGGAVTPGVAAKSMQQALPPGAPLKIWMQPRDQEFAGVTEAGLAAAVASELAAFQSCVEQDWPEAPSVSGFLCVKEQQLGGVANCDTLNSVFAAGVSLPGSSAPVEYGLLGAPGNLSRTDLSAALGEMYEPIYFPPSDACPDPSDGSTYGDEIGAWLVQAAVVPATGSVAVPAFGGPSATCQLDYDQAAPAAAALAGKVRTGLAGLALWG